MGIFIAIPIVTSGRADVIALPDNLQFGGWLGLAVVGALALPALQGRHAPNVIPPPAEDPRLRWKIIAAYAVIYLVWARRSSRSASGEGAAAAAVRRRRASARGRAAHRRRTLAARALSAHPAEWRYLLLFSLLMITFSNGVSTVALVHIRPTRVHC